MKAAGRDQWIISTEKVAQATAKRASPTQKSERLSTVLNLIGGDGGNLLAPFRRLILANSGLFQWLLMPSNKQAMTGIQKTSIVPAAA